MHYLISMKKLVWILYLGVLIAPSTHANLDLAINTNSYYATAPNKSVRSTNRVKKVKRNTCKNLFSPRDDFGGEELFVPDYAYIQEEFDYQKLNKILPADLTPTNEATKVFNKIADRGINALLTTESFRNSSLGVMSENIKDKTQAEIKFSSDLAPQIQHQMKAELLPFQGQTKFTYQGFFNADLVFKNNLNDYELKIKEKLFNKNVFYQNQISKNVTSNQLGISWDW